MMIYFIYIPQPLRYEKFLAGGTFTFALWYCIVQVNNVPP